MTNPVAKTFYNHRVFLIYQPDDYRRYLIESVDKKGWPKEGSTEYFDLSLGLLAWGTILVYRARMLPFDFNRELKRLVNESGEFIEQDPSIPVTRPLFRKQLAMQLGIEQIARRKYISERVAEIPVFQQYLYDTLYWPQFLHERGRHDLDENKQEVSFLLTHEKLRQHLWFRATGRPDESPDENFSPNEITRFLFSALEDYLDLLAEPRNIRTETMNYARQLDDKPQRDLWAALAAAIDTSDAGKLVVGLEKENTDRKQQ